MVERENQTPDIWTQRWHDPTLQNLGRWLHTQGYSDARAVFCVDSVWVFSSYYLFPKLHSTVPLAIMAGKVDNHNAIALLAPSIKKINTPDFQQTQEITREFERNIAIPLAQDPIIGFGTLPVASEKEFEKRVREVSIPGTNLLGIFKDDLKAELTKVMRPEAVDLWLQAPNEHYLGKKPQELLGNPDTDRPLRDLVLGVKQGLVSL